jgi:hypothetical protein
MSKIIMGFVLHDRVKTASTVQELLTSYGCEINTRIGLHVAAEGACSPHGLILLEFIDGAEDKAKEFEKKLKEIADVDVQKMVF